MNNIVYNPILLNSVESKSMIAWRRFFVLSYLALFCGFSSLGLLAQDRSLSVPAPAKVGLATSRLSSVRVDVAAQSPQQPPLFVPSPRTAAAAAIGKIASQPQDDQLSTERDLESGQLEASTENKSVSAPAPALEMATFGARKAAGSDAPPIRRLTRTEALQVSFRNWRKKTARRVADIKCSIYVQDALGVVDTCANGIATLTAANLVSKDIQNSDTGFLPDALDQVDAILTLVWVGQYLTRNAIYWGWKLKKDCCTRQQE